MEIAGAILLLVFFLIGIADMLIDWPRHRG